MNVAASGNVFRWDLLIGGTLFIVMGIAILIEANNGFIWTRSGKRRPIESLPFPEFVLVMHAIGGAFIIALGVYCAVLFVKSLF